MVIMYLSVSSGYYPVIKSGTPSPLSPYYFFTILATLVLFYCFFAPIISFNHSGTGDLGNGTIAWGEAARLLIFVCGMSV